MNVTVRTVLVWSGLDKPRDIAVHPPTGSVRSLTLAVKVLNVKCNSDYSVQNDESLYRHCTDERRVRKRDKKVRRDVI